MLYFCLSLLKLIIVSLCQLIVFIFYILCNPLLNRLGFYIQTL